MVDIKCELVNTSKDLQIAVFYFHSDIFFNVGFLYEDVEIGRLVSLPLAKYSVVYSLTRELQEIGLVGEDQVVVGDKVKEPNVQLLCVVALEDQFR